MTKGNCFIERLDGEMTDSKIIVFRGAIPSLEEADNRLLLHMRESISRGRKDIVAKTLYSDVIVIPISFTEFFKFDTIITTTVHYGLKNSRFIIINRFYIDLGELIASGLTFFHSFSGCD